MHEKQMSLSKIQLNLIYLMYLLATPNICENHFTPGSFNVSLLLGTNCEHAIIIIYYVE